MNEILNTPVMNFGESSIVIPLKLEFYGKLVDEIVKTAVLHDNGHWSVLFISNFTDDDVEVGGSWAVIHELTGETDWRAHRINVATVRSGIATLFSKTGSEATSIVVNHDSLRSRFIAAMLEGNCSPLRRGDCGELVQLALFGRIAY
jgi:hypothetical protein